MFAKTAQVCWFKKKYSFFFLFLLGEKGQCMHTVSDIVDTGKCKCLE